ncbi:MAG TPA: alpha/beta hydrolase [Kofleriaceae bacterium]|jgi:pimeloyl-ACP methyl ester carboxylesterase|nr:alpha/beta hydrolase [Kofleriaceae bacterium]
MRPALAMGHRSRLARCARWLALAGALGSCGAARPSERGDDDAPRHARGGGGGDPFAAAANFKPVAFHVEVKGHGRPVILIPGLGCPGEVWDDFVAHLGDDYETHVLTLSGFAGQDAIDEPLSAAVRRDLTRYIRSRRLRDPIIVGHSMGGFIAYWIASYHPELVGPVIVVDAGPALSGDLDEAKALRARWKYADDDEFAAGMRGAFMSMTTAAKKMTPIADAVVRSDRRAIGDAIYEMMTTDLTDKVKDITAPVLVIAADGGFQGRIRAQIETIPDHEMIVVPHTRHFVWYDDPDGFFKAVDKFLGAHPPPG